jgi:hypothetical protein
MHQSAHSSSISQTGGTIQWTAKAPGQTLQSFSFRYSQADNFQILIPRMTVNTADLPPTAEVPEPSSALILAGGLGLLAWRRSRRQH